MTSKDPVVSNYFLSQSEGREMTSPAGCLRCSALRTLTMHASKDSRPSNNLIAKLHTSRKDGNLNSRIHAPFHALHTRVRPG